MTSRTKQVLLWVYLLCGLSLGESVAEHQDHDGCAELSNTTWLEYRQHRTRTRLQVQYLLLTRRNTDCPHKLDRETLTQTPLFNRFSPTKVIIHGYRALGSRPSWVKDLAQALLRAQDVNVVVVDWVYVASFAYNLVVENYKEVALQVSVLINDMQKYGCKLENFHFIGVSLGAHVAGFVGTLFEGKIGRITGLDPAGPMFKGADTYDRLDPSDAQFVDAIHTDSDYFGISIPVGHVDFYLNGGKDQTGCARSRFPTSLSINSGIAVSPPPKEQKVFLLTTSLPPFCAHHILLVLLVSPLDKSAEIEVTLRTENLGSEQRLRLRTDSSVYRAVMAHPVALCEIHSITLRNTGARFYRQAEIHVKSVCISEFPSARREEPLCVNNIQIRRGTPWSHDFVQVCD